jgi:hypothetical protein
MMCKRCGKILEGRLDPCGWTRVDNLEHLYYNHCAARDIRWESLPLFLCALKLNIPEKELFLIVLKMSLTPLADIVPAKYPKGEGEVGRRPLSRCCFEGIVCFAKTPPSRNLLPLLACL